MSTLKGVMYLTTAACVLMLAGGAAAQAFSETEAFGEGWTIDDFGWFPDRFEPAGFDVAEFDGAWRLEHTVDGGDEQDDDFVNVQGMQRETNVPVAPIQSKSIDIYVGEDWDTEDRLIRFQPRVRDVNDEDSSWPVNIEIVGPGPEFNFNGPGDGVELVEDLSPPQPGQWYTLGIELFQGSGWRLSVDGLPVMFFDDDSPASHHMDIVYLNLYNFGETYSAYWDNLVVTDGETAQEPSISSPGMIQVGGSAELRVIAPAQLLEEASFQWYFQGQALDGETGATLTLTDVQVGDEGEYSVEIDHAAFSGTLVTSLSVAENLPAAGPIVIGLFAAALAVGGVAYVRRRPRKV